MERHLNELIGYIPDFLNRSILDLGAGRGRFMFEVKKRGGNIVGLEPYKKYIEEAYKRASEEKVSLDIKEGVAENLPFGDKEFGFVNMNEVIEHVNDAEKSMKEVFRVLKEGGKVYISVPNRFGLKDQHFNLYFVNWLPRSWSNTFISLFGKHKDYSGENGLQRLDQMHYYTYSRAKKFFESIGFTVSDIRENKIRMKFKNIFLKKVILVGYKFFRFFHFDSFHILLVK